MKKRRQKELEDILDSLYGHWQDVRRETITSLGEKQALKIIDFHGNNWIDIISWISSTYLRQEQMNIVNFQFTRIFKEVYWLQFLFFAGNYPAVYRNLRYMWEMMSQAYYVDYKYSELSLDEQFAKVRMIEEHTQGWNIVVPTLCRVLKKSGKKIEFNFRPLWDELNRYVHPSAKQLDLIAEADFSSLVTDSFSEPLAKGVLQTTDKVLDITYAIMMKKFMKIIELVRGYKFIKEWEDCLPYTMTIIRGNTN